MYGYVKRCMLLAVGLLSVLALTACNPYDNSGLKLVFQDDFNGTTLDTSKWIPYNGPGNAGYGLRSPSAVSLDGNGSLVMTASMSGSSVVSGGMSARQNFTYGRYVVRVRTEADPTQVTSGVVLTWPKSNNSPPDGENDIYETGPTVARSPFFSYIHYGGVQGGSTDQQYRTVQNADGTQWHTIVMDWAPGYLNLYRDGVLVSHLNDTVAIPDVAHKLCIQLDARSGRPLTRPIRMYVDYVRVYLPA